MANIKLKNANGQEIVYQNVTKVTLKDTSDNDVVYEQGLSGASVVTLLVDGSTFQKITVPTGNQIVMPTNPVKSGFVFTGWSTTDGGQVDVSFPYTVTQNVNLYAVWNTVIQYKSTITNLGSSSPASVAFSTNANLQNWVPEEVTIGSDIFIKFPTFYRKVTATSSGQITGFIISSWKEDNDFKPYSCFIDESGNVLPYILIGKYMMSSTSVANSVNATYKTMTLATGRNLAQLKGTGYQLYDWQIHKLFQDLVIAQKLTVDTNSGTGFESILNIAHQKNGFLIDGVARDGTTWVFSYKPSKYTTNPTATTTDYVTASYTAPSGGGNITKLGYDENNPFFSYPNTASGSSYTQYYCDNYSYASGNHPVRCYVGYTNADVGVFYCVSSDDWSFSFGVRLCYRPL